MGARRKSDRRQARRRPSAPVDPTAGPPPVEGAWRRAKWITQDLLERLISCALLLIYFKEGYSWSHRSHTGGGIVEAALPVDAWIPLAPEFIVFYMFGYLFVLVPCVLIKKRSDFHAATVVFFLMLTAAFIVFRYAPVHMEKTIATGADWFSRVTRFQQTRDTGYNNFPSLHVALNVYAFALIAWQWRGLSRWWLPLPVLIVCSTLLVKQHLLVDVIGGLLLAWAGHSAFRWLADKGTRVTQTCWLAMLALLVLVVLTHLERLAKTAASIQRFLNAGGVPLSGAAAALLLFLLAVLGIRLAVERIEKPGSVEQGRHR